MAHCLLICFAGCCVAHSVDSRGVVVATVCHPSWAYVKPMFTTLCCAAGVATHEVRTQRLTTFFSASQGVASRKVSIPAALVATAGPPTGRSTHMLLAMFAFVRKMFSPARFRSQRHRGRQGWFLGGPAAHTRLPTFTTSPQVVASERGWRYQRHRACHCWSFLPGLRCTQDPARPRGDAGFMWKVCCRTFHRPRSSRCRTRWGELLSAPRVARRVVPDVDVSPGHTHRDLGTFGLTTLEVNTALDALSHKPLAAE